MRSINGLLLAVILTASSAAAQDAPIVSLAPGDPARWDAAVYAGWRGVDKSDIAPEWNEWYEAASFGASAGYYWTPHLKIELDVSATTDGTVLVQEQIVVPGAPFPLFRYGEHRFRSTSVSGGALYQFAENTWFHPFVGGGVESVRERALLTVQEQPLCQRVPCAPVPLPGETSISYRARPFAAAGFKWYMTERAFFRSDIRSTFSTAGAEAVTWHAGIGVDF
jgi:opacity protein-like surface antigen